MTNNLLQMRFLKRHPALTRIGLGMTLSLAALISVATLISGCLSAPGYEGPRTAHFDGERFKNAVSVPEKSLVDVLSWWWHRDPPSWKERPIRVSAEKSPGQVDEQGRIRVTFINHSTLLLQLDGVNILTDPVYSARIGPVSFLGPARHHPPGMPFDELPPIHVVLISHNHYDHLDLPTLKRLAREHRPRILVPLGNGALLQDHDIERGEDHDWWQSSAIGPGLRVTFTPSRHWSGRGLGDRYKTLWGAWVIEGSGGPIYFAGDTGWGPHFAEARQRFGPMRLALLPIGAYKPRWFMRAAHISPAEAVHAHSVLEAGTSVATHFGTFRLGDDRQDEPPTELRRALEDSDLGGTRFWVLSPGEAREIPGPHQSLVTGILTKQ
jgi:L-ascorbate metabolism protein UlaG (beta-lactamase superfamily)